METIAWPRLGHGRRSVYTGAPNLTTSPIQHSRDIDSGDSKWCENIAKIQNLFLFAFSVSFVGEKCVFLETRKERFRNCSRRRLHPVPPVGPKHQFRTLIGPHSNWGPKVASFMNFGNSPMLPASMKHFADVEFTPMAEKQLQIFGNADPPGPPVAYP